MNKCRKGSYKLKNKKIEERKYPEIKINKLFFNLLEMHKIKFRYITGAKAAPKYSNLSKKDVTGLATWKVVTPGGGTISANGFLSLPPTPPETITVSATFDSMTGQGSVAILTKP